MQSVHAGAVQTHFFEFDLDSEMFQENLRQTSKKTANSSSKWTFFAVFLETFSRTGYRKGFWFFFCRSGAKTGAEWVPFLVIFVTFLVLFCFSPFSRVGRIYGADLPPSCRTPLTDLKGVCLRPVSRDAFGEGLAACVAATALLARSGSSRGRIYRLPPLPPTPPTLDESMAGGIGG